MTYIRGGSLDTTGDFLLSQVELAAAVTDNLRKGVLLGLFRHRTIISVGGYLILLLV
jgi:hypothetical protein